MAISIIDFGGQVAELGFVVNWTGSRPVVDELKQVSSGAERGVCLGDVLVEINGVLTEGKGRDVLLPMLKSRPVALQVHHAKGKGQPGLVATETPPTTIVGRPSSTEEILMPAAQVPTPEEKSCIPPKSPKGKYTSWRLITVSLLGSLDDFAVFVSLLLSGIMSALQLSIGVLLGSFVVVSICMAAGKLACVVNIVEKIPLWAVIGAFSLWTYISTFALS